MRKSSQIGGYLLASSPDGSGTIKKQIINR